MSNMRINLENIPRLLLLIHTIIVIAWSSWMLYAVHITNSMEAAMGIWLYMYIDFPMGTLAAYITSPLWGGNIGANKYISIIAPSIIFTVAGGLQYYIIGKIVVSLLISKWGYAKRSGIDGRGGTENT